MSKIVRKRVRKCQKLSEIVKIGQKESKVAKKSKKSTKRVKNRVRKCQKESKVVKKWQFLDQVVYRFHISMDGGEHESKDSVDYENYEGSRQI